MLLHKNARDNIITIICSYRASGFTGLFAGQYNTEDYGIFTGDVQHVNNSGIPMILVIKNAIAFCNQGKPRAVFKISFEGSFLGDFLGLNF